MTEEAESPVEVARASLVLANHILAHHSVLDAFGHVSIRHPVRSDRFIISRSMAPAAVNDADLMIIRDDGRPLDEVGHRPFIERFIHSAIYKARPDVCAVVHSHSSEVIPFGVVRDAPLRPIFHMAGFIGAQAPIFEIRDYAGDASDMLIRTPELGDALAGALAMSAVILMRGHGFTSVGADLKQAVFRAIYLATNARIQINASRLGTPLFLNQAEAANAEATNNPQIERAWALWCRDV
jgi:ribulose-5-phosphate 4-epimerase/fuculose-1-phosphate aldolase